MLAEGHGHRYPLLLQGHGVTVTVTVTVTLLLSTQVLLTSTRHLPILSNTKIGIVSALGPRHSPSTTPHSALGRADQRAPISAVIHLELRGTQPRRRHVAIDGLPGTLWHLIDLVEDADVADGADLLEIPGPGFGVQGAVGVAVHVVGVAEVHDHHVCVVAAAVAAGPGCAAQEAVFFGARFDVIDHFGEVGGLFSEVGLEHAERAAGVVSFDVVVFSFFVSFWDLRVYSSSDMEYANLVLPGFVVVALSVGE